MHVIQTVPDQSTTCSQARSYAGHTQDNVTTPCRLLLRKHAQIIQMMQIGEEYLCDVYSHLICRTFGPNMPSLHLTRGVPKVRNLHAVQPDGRRADVVSQVDDELEQQTRKVPGLGPDVFHHDERRHIKTNGGRDGRLHLSVNATSTHAGIICRVDFLQATAFMWCMYTPSQCLNGRHNST